MQIYTWIYTQFYTQSFTWNIYTGGFIEASSQDWVSSQDWILTFTLEHFTLEDLWDFNLSQFWTHICWSSQGSTFPYLICLFELIELGIKELTMSSIISS